MVHDGPSPAGFAPTPRHRCRPRRRRDAGIALALAALVLPPLAGCVTAEESTGPPRAVGGGLGGIGGGSTAGNRPAPVRSSGPDVTAILDEPLGTAAPVFSSDVAIRVESLGSVPWDELLLPVVHPAGTLVAVQVGLPPDWDAILAEEGAEPPVTSRIEVWRLAESEQDEARMVAAIDEPAVLGRAANEDGFLIESPRTNGERWIGLADWETGSVRWIVREPGRVAAFASLGPGGLCAWSSRAVGGEDFDLAIGVLAGAGLVVERGRMPGRGASWLVPSFSGVGTGLFAALLDDEGRLDAVHLDVADAGSMRRSLRRVELARDGATVRTAWQMLSLHQGLVGGPNAIEPAVEILHFRHPSRIRRAAWWTPDRPLPEILEPGTVGLLPDRTNPNYGLIVFDDGRRRALVRGNLFSEIDRLEVMDGLHVPRPVAGRDRDYLVFTPVGRELLCTVAQFLPVEVEVAPPARRSR